MGVEGTERRILGKSDGRDPDVVQRNLRSALLQKAKEVGILCRDLLVNRRKDDGIVLQEIDEKPRSRASTPRRKIAADAELAIHGRRNDQAVITRKQICTAAPERRTTSSITVNAASGFLRSDSTLCPTFEPWK